MQESFRKGTECRVCTGCGKCFAGRGVSVIADGGLAAFWQEKIRKSENRRENGAGTWLVAVDIGTTTIAMVFYDPAGEEKDRYTAVNPQAKYGADVISRITQAQDRLKAEWMKDSVRSVLEKGVERFRAFLKTEGLEKEGGISHGRGRIPPGSGKEAPGDPPAQMRMVVAANTAMMYLLMGYPVRELGEAPFRASYLSLAHTKLAGLDTTLLPGLSAFVGADITAGIYACGMAEQEEITLLIDLGTNGEIVLGNRKKILASSTAAGPAFEGGAAKGIWGSDMVSLAAKLRRENILDETGLLADPYFDEGILMGGVKITQRQIRQFQVAKAAVAAGIKMLMERYGLKEPGEIGRIVLAGGFGYYLKAEDAAEIGLFPAQLSCRAISAGNAALAGVLRYAYTGEKALELEEIADKAETVNLAALPGFQEAFLDAVSLKKWEKDK